MKLCFICAEYPPAPHGGIGSVTRVLGRSLAARGHEVRVVGLYPEKNLLGIPRYEEDLGVKVWRDPMPARRLSWIGARLSLYRRISDWVNKGEIDLVEVPDWEGLAAGWPALGAPVVTRLHGSSCYFSKEIGTSYKKSIYWLERAALRRSDYWCSVSRYTAERTRALFTLTHPPASVIYNPVDIEGEADFGSRSHTDVIFSGTLTPKKGIVSLIRAWHRVIEAEPKAKLHLFGKETLLSNGSSMTEYLRSELPASVRSSVSFYGHTQREQVLAELRKARVAVFPSYAEAFAMAPLESMAAGCPTIYSERGSGPELIQDGCDGILVNPDEPREIAAAITRVLADDLLARNLGAAGRRKVQRNFSIGQILRTNEEFYEGCLNHFRTRMN